MFASRFRKATLSLAGAALVATSLMTSIAAAAPADSLPSSADVDSTVAAKPYIKLPLADLSVTPLGLTHDATFQNVEYRFRVANNGPDRLTFRVEKKALWAYNGQPNGTQDQSAINYVRSGGESFEVVVHCALSGDPSHYCNGADVKVTPVNGLDNNMANNYSFMPNTFQP
jgi:hypothetical protein